MVYRVFVEKRPEISQARTLCEDIKESLLIKNLSKKPTFVEYFFLQLLITFFND